MAAFLRRSLISSRDFLYSHRQQSSLRSSNHIFQFFMKQTSQAIQKSPFESNILSILGNEIEYQLDYAPPHSPDTKFNTFMVEDWPGEQWITLRRKFGKDEHIKIEAMMIDGAITVPKANDENLREDVRLHISVLVDIWKGEVVQCKIAGFIGIRGIMIRETVETFGIITEENKFQVVPKKLSVFMLQVDCWKVTLLGDKLISRNMIT